MAAAPDYYAAGPEALVVSLAAKGDRTAFAELVRRRQGWLRNLMRRLSRDSALADDLAQQVFLKVWRKLRQLDSPERFGAWIKRIAVNEWMQYQRRNDPLWKADTLDGLDEPIEPTPGLAMDLDRALAELPPKARLCVVLSNHERMSHAEISTLT